MNKANAPLIEKNCSSDELTERFLSRAVQISIFGGKVGLDITPTTDRKLPLFRKLSLADQILAVQKIEESCEIFASLIREKGDLRSSFSLVWMACSRLGLRPPSDFFDKLSDDDVVQVYSEENIHRFSNLKFFKMCSYTLEQLYTLPWHLLWTRSQADTDYLIDCVTKFTSPTQRTTMMFHAPFHRIWEVSSVFMYESNYRLKCAAPLFDRETGMRNGYIVCESAEVLTKHAPFEEERMLIEFEKKHAKFQDYEA